MSSSRRGFRGTAQNSKTKICLRWKSGHCRFGERCNFAHGELELRRRGSTNESPWSTDFARGQEGFVPSAPPLRGTVMYPLGSLRQLRQLTDPAVGSMLGTAHPLLPGPHHAMMPSLHDGMTAQAAGGVRTLPRSDLAQAIDPLMPDAGIGQGMPEPGTALSMVPLSSELWAQQGYPIPGHNGWTRYRDKQTGEPYYHNQHTLETTWDPPPGWGGM